MSRRSAARDFVDLLGRVSGGSLEVEVDGRPLAKIDGEGRTLTVQVAPLLAQGIHVRPILREGHVRLWQAHGIPSALARAGWQVSLQDGSRELVGLGRAASRLTGHIHMSPTALGKLRRLL